MIAGSIVEVFRALQLSTKNKSDTCNKYNVHHTPWLLSSEAARTIKSDSSVQPLLPRPQPYSGLPQRLSPPSKACPLPVDRRDLRWLPGCLHDGGEIHFF